MAEYALTSEKNDLILKNLMLARKDMGAILKDANNTFHKSKYATLAAYIEAVDGALFTHGLIIYQCIVDPEKDKPVLVTTLSHPDSNQWIRSYSPLINPANSCQGFGSSVTYMRRYSMGALLGLYPEDDDGETADGRGKNAKKEPKQPAPPQQQQKGPPPIIDLINNEEFKELIALLAQVTPAFKRNLENLLISNGVSDYKFMTKKLFSEQKPLIKNNIKEKNKLNTQIVSEGDPF